jgi:hypothetical protein
MLQLVHVPRHGEQEAETGYQDARRDASGEASGSPDD